MCDFDKIVNREGSEALKLEFRKEVFGVEDVLPLWVADMDFEAPKEVKEALEKRIEHSIYGYTVRGDNFFNAIISWVYNRYNWNINKDFIEFTPGVLPAIVTALHEFTKPGDNVIVQTPVYYPFYSIVNNNDRVLLSNRLIENDGYYTIDFDNLECLAKDPKTKVLLISNPHNPVGRAWNRDELAKIIKICAANDVMIISDEIHSDLCLFGNKHIVMANEFPEYAHKIITCMAASKSFNIAGLSTAYVVIADKEAKERFKKRLYAFQMQPGNLFGGITLEAVYNHGAAWLDKLKEYLEANIMLTDSFIKENMPEVKFRIPEATYLLWLDFREWNLTQEELSKAFVEIGKVAMNDGSSFGIEGKGFFRMNVASPKSVIEEGLMRILKVRNKVYKK